MLVEGLEPLPAGTLDALRRASTASITTELFKLGIRHSFMTGVAPLERDQRMVGEAVTLRYLPFREDLMAGQNVADPNHPQRHTIEHLGAGEILVIDARGDLRSGTLGDILTAKMKANGAAGFVTDGAIRDVAGIRKVGLPVYVGGVHASASTTLHYAADANLPVSCGGITVCPGDVLVGDADGVVVVPRALAAAVAEHVAGKDELEAYIYELISGGASLRGVYPPNEETIRAFEARRKAP